MDAFRTLIVPDAHVALTRTITETLAPVGGKGMYTTGLSLTGAEPTTHWISSGFIDPDYAALLPHDGAGGYPKVIVQMCAGAGLTVALADVEALLQAADITTETPQQAMARLGVQLVTELEPESEPFRPS